MDRFFIKKASIIILCVLTLCIFTSGSKNEQQNIQENFQEHPREEMEADQLAFITSEIAYILTNSAKSENLILSDEAVDVMTQEVIIWKSYEDIPLSNITLTNDESNQLIGVIAEHNIPGWEVKGDFAFSAIADKKASLATELFPEEITLNAEIFGVKMTPEANGSLESDLLNFTKLTAESWLPIQEIHSRNINYIQTVFNSTPSMLINDNIYRQIKLSIFTKYIELSVYSIPNGASVSLDGELIGQTPILDIPLPSSKKYTFSFKLRGYKKSNVKYYTDPREEKQNLKVPLVKN